MIAFIERQLWAPELRARLRVVSRDHIVLGGVLFTAAAVVAQMATQSIDFGVYGLRIAALDSNVHASIFGIASLVAQGAAAGAIAVRSIGSRRRGLWVLLSALVSALLAVRIFTSYGGVLLLPPVAVVFILLWQLTSDDPAPARAIVRGALILLAFSFLVHLVGPKIVTALGYGGNTWPYQVKGILKHSTEMAGWILVATGVAAAARVSASL